MENIEFNEEWFKYFRAFLRENGLLKDFLECFRKQDYVRKFDTETISNYREIMRKRYDNNYYFYNRYGAMYFTFDSFTWVDSKVKIPIEFTRRWCTICLKWGFYCLKNDLEICPLWDFVRLYDYWTANGWIEFEMITAEEDSIYKKVIEYQQLKKFPKE